MVYTGLLVGLVFGFTAQQGRFCIKSAFQDLQLFRDFTLLKSLLIALVVQLAGFGLLAALGWIVPEPKPFYWTANVFGGLIFGAGMVLAGGCAGSITYRMGEGNGQALIAVIGFFLASIMTAVGIFSPIAGYFQSTSLILTTSGVPPTLASLLGLPYSVVALCLAILILLAWIASRFYQRHTRYVLLEQDRLNLPKSLRARPWSWRLTGIVIGLSGIGAFLLSPATGRNYPLGITHGYVNLYKFTIGINRELSWDTALVSGVILGAWLAAFWAKEFKLRLPTIKLALQMFVGGWLMGFGAVTAGGCTIGHLISGVPLLSLGSLLSAGSMVAGSWLFTWLLFHRPVRQKQPNYKAAK